ncbi:RDD family protein [Mycobacterium sp. ITM-2016-00317]|uniref:RDD family protein n=1 Tax=Mycobacterium sp. ITM-2016-00317 TaxID=2099694 RepID=UPI00287F8108|nr:RDD family protein [Mycobacterium sp. ITM-2016-00317]WNG85670.1 RDD family protein [Mycobacterium sp. ITM-2016-00317]
MARSIGSWLSGPSQSDDPDQRASTYPGQRLGLPETGPGSIARFGRRIGALCIDWLFAVGITALAVPLGLMSREEFFYSLDARNVALVVWLVLGVASVRMFSFTPGQLALGLKVVSVDNRAHVSFGRALARNLLVLVVIPALFTDADLRGLHDLATKTAVVRR